MRSISAPAPRFLLALLMLVAGTDACAKKAEEPVTPKNVVKKAGEVAKAAGDKAVTVVVGTPPPTPTPTPTPLPVFPSSMVKVFPDSAKWRPPELPAPVIAVHFKVLTATDPAARRGPPRLSPDGMYVAYDEGEGDERRLIVRETTGDLVRSVRLPEDQTTPSARSPFAWSPTSTALVFTRQVDTGGYGLFLLDLQGTERLLDAGPVVDGQVDWNPAGDAIAFIRTDDTTRVWFLDPTDQDVEPRAPVDVLAPVRDLAFSPDGMSLAFASGARERDIYVARELGAESASVLRLTRWYFDDVRPGWSPDGGQLAFYSTYAPDGMPGTWSLFVIRPDGRDPPSGVALAQRMVVSDVEIGSSPPSWVPKRRWPLCAKEAESGYFALWAANPKNQDLWRIDPETRVNRDVDTGPNGLIAFRSQHDWAEHIVLGLLYLSDSPFTSRSWP